MSSLVELFYHHVGMLWIENSDEGKGEAVDIYVLHCEDIGRSRER
jgi:hypothetical protein